MMTSRDPERSNDYNDLGNPSDPVTPIRLDRNISKTAGDTI